MEIKVELLCTKCGKPKIDLTKAMCETCREKRTKRSNEYKKTRKEQGLCVFCGKTNDRGEGKRCSVCLEKFQEKEKNKSRICKTCNVEKVRMRLMPVYKELTLENIDFEEDESVEMVEVEDFICEKCWQKEARNSYLVIQWTLKQFGLYCSCCDVADIHFLTIIPKSPMSKLDTYNWGERHRVLKKYHWLNYVYDELSPLEEEKNSQKLEELKSKYQVICFNCYSCMHTFNRGCCHKLRKEVQTKSTNEENKKK